MTREEYNKIRAWAIATGNQDRFVILKEDEQGRYIEYAFREGAPAENRCLSWYDSFQPKALERNGWDLDEWKKTRLHPTDRLYELHMFSCGNQDISGDGHCSPGHPCKHCLDVQAKHWTPAEPVKCACWFLETVENIGDYKLTLEQADKYCSIMQANSIL